MKIVFWLYMFKKGSYKLLNIIFENPSIGDQILILVQNSTKTCFLTKKLKKMCFFALKIVFWLYMLEKESYGLLNIIFEKYIFGDQIYISSANINKNVFVVQKMKENVDFCIENRFLALHA